MPIQVIEDTNSITNLIRFQTSAVYELIISLHTLLYSGQQKNWISTTRATLPPEFFDELAEIYEPFFKGALFFELAIDYPDHDDVPGFIDYVRRMDPVTFLFYIVGRIVTRDEIARTKFDLDALHDLLLTSPAFAECFCDDVPMDRILHDVPAFQHRLADFWQWYWDLYFCAVLTDLAPHWTHAINEKTNILARLGGEGLLEHIANKTTLPAPMPSDHPITEVVFIPLYLIPVPAYFFYGYGNVTVLFDSERTESRLEELKQTKEQMLNLLKALGDNSRLDILRLIALSEGQYSGKKIAARLKLSASAVSRHLAQLKEVGLISEASEDNRTITYHFQSDAVKSLPDKLLDLLYH
jgi:DNA-binding transcriptional ArsR family regulator